MAKNSNQYVCQSCGAISAKWAGRCESCGEWNTIVEESVTVTPKGMKPGKSKGLEIASLADTVAPHARESTGILELDRVLGGGLVEGSAILLGGDPGIGKSTLLLQAAAILAGGHSSLRVASHGEPEGRGSAPLSAKGVIPHSRKNVLYISGEESLAQIQLRSQRLGLSNAPLQLATATSVREILASVDVARVAFHGEPRAAGVSAKRVGAKEAPSIKILHT